MTDFPTQEPIAPSAETNEAASSAAEETHSTPDETEPTAERDAHLNAQDHHTEACYLGSDDPECMKTPDPGALDVQPSSNAEQPTDADPETAAVKLTPGQHVKLRGVDVEIVAVHADGTFDCHVRNEDGSLKLNTDGTSPLWYERQSPAEITD